MADGHPLKPIVLRCLRNHACHRPKAENVHRVVKAAASLARDMISPQRDPVSMATVMSQMSTLLQHVQEQQTAIGELAARQEEMGENVATVSDRVATMERTMDAVPDNVVSISQQLQCLNQRSVDINQRVCAINVRTNRVMQGHESIEQRVTAINNHTADMVPRVTAIDNRIASMEQRLSATDTDSSTGTIQPRVERGPAPPRPASRRTAVEQRATTGSDHAMLRQGRQWTKVRVRCRPGSRIGATVVLDNTFIVVLCDADDRITEMLQTSDLLAWHKFILPVWESNLKNLTKPLISSVGLSLYMCCYNHLRKRVILKFCLEQKSVNGIISKGRWGKIADAPCYDVHTAGAMHITASSISLFGGISKSAPQPHVSTYSLLHSAWSSSDVLPSRHLLSELPSPACHASILQFNNSMYLVGGQDGVFFQQPPGDNWRSARPPTTRDLSFSAACKMSDKTMAIARFSPGGETSCTVYNVETQEAHDLPLIAGARSFHPTLAMFKNSLLCSVAGQYLWKLDIQAV